MEAGGRGMAGGGAPLAPVTMEKQEPGVIWGELKAEGDPDRLKACPLPHPELPLLSRSAQNPMASVPLVR